MNETFEAKVSFYENEIASISEQKVIEIEKFVRENEILK